MHKVCHFFSMQTESATTSPQRAEGITACRWVSFDGRALLVSYANAREVLRRATTLVERARPPRRERMTHVLAGTPVALVAVVVLAARDARAHRSCKDAFPRRRRRLSLARDSA